ncbi:WS/DGAT/MGAT family O-acyltransferase [Lentisalinibacter orientalis]|uniref:WS/DGAT/MGAT family O-acyltransferase n=1 Tax=Lentisalinibacter orientalis TaxID=2992241 RepID=UPI003869BB00
MLKQLSGLDSLFLYAESERAPLEVSSLQIYDPSTHPAGRVKFTEILATFAARIDRSKVFRRKLLPVPFALDYPYWVEDEDFDLEYHVRHIALPKPGDWRQLMDLVARLQAQQLDLARPLWVVYIIEGLNEVPGVKPGCFGMFMKMHHATIDGVSGQEIQAAIHDFEPVPADGSRYEPAPGRTQPAPGAARLLLRSPVSNLAKSLRLGGAVAAALPGLVRAGLASRGRERTPVPKTVFNRGRVSPSRVVDGHVYDLAEVKAVSKALDGTINDVVLAVVAGALRRYLAARDELPEETLVAACPMNVRGEDDHGHEVDNLVSAMLTPLHTEIADPVERVRAIHQGTEDAKAVMEAIGPRRMAEIPMNLPSPVARGLLPLLMELTVRSGTVAFNTMVTNVAGIQKPVYLAGAEMVAMLGMGPVVHQAGLFHAVFSYNGVISVMFTACRQMLPDPEFYAECIDASYREVRDAALSGEGRRRKTGDEA